MKKYFYLLIFILIIILCPSCKKDNPINEEPLINEGTFFNEEINVTIYAGEDYLIEPKVQNIDNPKYKIEIISLTDEEYTDIVSLEGFLVKGLSKGKVTILVKLDGYDDWKIQIEVLETSLEEIVINYKEVTLEVGKTMKIEYTLVPNIKAELLFSSSSKEIAEVSDDGEILAISKGSCYITLKAKDNYNIIERFKLNVIIPKVNSIEVVHDNIELGFDEEYELKYSVLPLAANQDVIITSSDDMVVTILNNNLIKSNYKGTAIIKIESKENSNIYKEIKVKVDGPISTNINLSTSAIETELGLKNELIYSVSPLLAYQHLDIEYDKSALEVFDDYIIGYKSGEYDIHFKTIDGSNIDKILKLIIKEEDKPIFRLDENYKDHEVINWNADFNLSDGITAFDSKDGNLTDKINVTGELDTKIIGEYKIEYSVTSSSDITITMERTIEVKWLGKTKVIGHAGSYYGVPNSEEAILAAARDMHYPAIEVDLKQTKDGVFVLSHDPDFGGYNLEDYDYSFLKDIEVTITRNKGIVPLNTQERTYTGKLCTLKRYLEICKEYNVIAVIELKTSNGISNWTELNNPTGSRLPALMEEIKSVGMEHNVIFLSNQYECLYWTRKNGYDYIPCQYLVNNLSSNEYLNRCINYHLDISTNVRDGIVISDEWLNKYKDANVKISTYTFEEYASYKDVQDWIDRGVDFVTCDWHHMEELNFD